MNEEEYSGEVECGRARMESPPRRKALPPEGSIGPFDSTDWTAVAGVGRSADKPPSVPAFCRRRARNQEF